MLLDHQYELNNVLEDCKNSLSEVIFKLSWIECDVMIRKENERKINEQNCEFQTCNVNNQSSQRECLEILDMSDSPEDNKMKLLKLLRNIYKALKIVNPSFVED